MTKEERKLKNREWQRNFYNRNKERLQAKARYDNAIIRDRVLFEYSDGEMCCASCLYTDERALTIDHVDNNGAEHRKQLKRANIYIWLEQNNYPPGYQVLCHNCNWIKHIENKNILL